MGPRLSNHGAGSRNKTHRSSLGAKRLIGPPARERKRKLPTGAGPIRPRCQWPRHWMAATTSARPAEHWGKPSRSEAKPSVSRRCANTSGTLQVQWLGSAARKERQRLALRNRAEHTLDYDGNDGDHNG